MPNIRGGKGFKRGKKGQSKQTTDAPLAESALQRYGCILRKLGGNRMEINCSDSEVRQGLITGAFRKKIWLNPGDIVLVEVSEFNKKECYITHKYDNTDAKNLRSKGLITFDVKSDDPDPKNNIVFGDTADLSDDDDDVYAQMDKAEKAETKKKEQEEVVDDPLADEEFNKPLTAKEKEKLAMKRNKKEKEQQRNKDRNKKDAELDIDSI
jgi:translation initiation factor 1A